MTPIASCRLAAVLAVGLLGAAPAGAVVLNEDNYEFGFSLQQFFGVFPGLEASQPIVFDAGGVGTASPTTQLPVPTLGPDVFFPTLTPINGAESLTEVFYASPFGNEENIHTIELSLNESETTIAERDLSLFDDADPNVRTPVILKMDYQAWPVDPDPSNPFFNVDVSDVPLTLTAGLSFFDNFIEVGAVDESVVTQEYFESEAIELIADGELRTLEIPFDLPTAAEREALDLNDDNGTFDPSLVDNFNTIESVALTLAGLSPRVVTFDTIELVLANAASLDGDFNGDGSVDAADYTVFRDNFGATEDGTVLSGNGTGGVVDGDDLALWAANYGTDAAAAAVPEPASVGLVLVGCVLARVRRSAR